MKLFGKILFITIAIIFISACQPRKPEKEIASAVQQNNGDKVSEYLAKGGNPNAVSRFGDPLLYLAVGRQGGVEVTKILIKAGAKINAQSKSGITALTSAASWCNAEEVILLIQGGADVNLKGKNGRTPIQSVCETPKKRKQLTIDILTSAGAIK